MTTKLKDGWPPYRDVEDHIEAQIAEKRRERIQAEQELARAQEELAFVQRQRQWQLEEERRRHKFDLAKFGVLILMWMFFWRAIFNMGRKK